MRRVPQPLCSHAVLGNSNKALSVQSLSLKCVPTSHQGWAMQVLTAPSRCPLGPSDFSGMTDTRKP